MARSKMGYSRCHLLRYVARWFQECQCKWSLLVTLAPPADSSFPRQRLFADGAVYEPSPHLSHSPPTSRSKSIVARHESHSGRTYPRSGAHNSARTCQWGARQAGGRQDVVSAATPRLPPRSRQHQLRRIRSLRPRSTPSPRTPPRQAPGPPPPGARRHCQWRCRTRP